MDLHRSHWPIRATAGITALVFVTSLVGFGPASLPAQAADPLTALYLDAGYDGVGTGDDPLPKSWVLFGDDADRVAARAMFQTTDGWRVSFDDWDSSSPSAGSWDVAMLAPPGVPLAVGSYTDAVDAWDREAGQPGVKLQGRNGCQGLTGGFTIHELAHDGLILERLSASFWLDCDDDSGNTAQGTTYGEVRFNATSGGFKAGQHAPRLVDHGLADSGSPASERGVTIKSIGTQALSVTGARIIGQDSTSFGVASDGCSGKTLAPGESCVITVSATPSTNRIENAKLEVTDDTYRGRRAIPLRVRGVGEIDGTAVIGPGEWYPVEDSYLDDLVVHGERNGEQAVNVKVHSVASGELIHEDTVALGSGDYRWKWNGHIDGTPIPVGKYDVTATLTDNSPNTKVLSRQVRVFHDYVTWQKKTSTRKGREIWAWGHSKNASISTRGSAWSTGLRLNSGKGFGAIVYSFPVAKSPSNIYGWMSFEVSGKSPNKRKALLAIWNPKLGSALDLKNYDVTKKVGPGYRWWKTGVNGQKHKKNGKARAAVMVWKGLGGWGKSVFDVRRVRLVYKVGTLHKVTTASGTSALGQTLRSRGPDGVAGTRVSRVPGSDVLRPLTMAPPLEAPPPEADATAAPGEPEADATAAPGSDESRPSRGSRGRLPAPDPAPTDDPAE